MSRYLNTKEYTQYIIQQSNAWQKTEVGLLIAQGEYNQAEKELQKAGDSGEALYLLSLIAELRGNSEKAMQLLEEAAEAGSGEAIALLLPDCKTLEDWVEVDDQTLDIFNATENDIRLCLVNKFADLNDPALMVDEEDEQAAYEAVEFHKNSCSVTLELIRNHKEALEEEWRQREEKAKAEQEALERRRAKEQAEKERREAAIRAEIERCEAKEQAKRNTCRAIFSYSQYIQSGVWVLALVILIILGFCNRSSLSANIEMTIVALGCIGVYAGRLLLIESAELANKESVTTPAYCICSALSDFLWLPLLAVPAFVMYSTSFAEMEALQSFVKILGWIVLAVIGLAALALADLRAVIILITVVLFALFFILVAFDILSWWGIACLPIVLILMVCYLGIGFASAQLKPIILISAIRPILALLYAYFVALLLGNFSNPISTLIAAYDVIFKTFASF